MKIRLCPAPKAPTASDLVVALAFKDEKPRLPARFAAAVERARRSGDLATGLRKWSLFHPDQQGVKRIGFVGLDKRKELDAERLRRAAAVAQERAEGVGAAELQLWLDAADHAGVAADRAGRAIAEGLILGAYRYQPARKEKPEVRKAQSALVVYAGRELAAFARGFALGEAGARATAFARDLANRPPNVCTPGHLAAAARKLAGRAVKVKVLERRDMQRLRMGALLGVAKGSSEPPKVIVLDHRPPRARRTVCIVGKGLTFDSGGISIKPAAKMDEMRYDMCGAAAVLGLFQAIAAGALRGGRTRVVGLVGTCENMPDASAQKPGDVVRAFDGHTIEVLNTDAEGRLVLADVLAYAKSSFAPDCIVDLATLTGAVVVALGHEISGAIGNHDQHVQSVIAAGKEVDELLWQLPLLDFHKEQVKSKFADLANINGPQHGNGSIAAAAFLWHFVGDTPWVHLDIAGTAYGGRAKDYYRQGASGVGVRTLLQWVRSLG